MTGEHPGFGLREPNQVFSRPRGWWPKRRLALFAHFIKSVVLLQSDKDYVCLSWRQQMKPGCRLKELLMIKNGLRPFRGWFSRNSKQVYNSKKAPLGPIHTGCDAQCNASKWGLLMWMGVSTLHTSNIKGKMFQFACASHPASCVDWALWNQDATPHPGQHRNPPPQQ